MAKEKKPESKVGKAVALAREIPTPKSSLKTTTPKTSEKDDKK